MLGFAVTVLFIVTGIAAAAVIADGFIRGTARYRELQHMLARDRAARLVTVQIDGDRRSRSYRQPAAVAKVVFGPAICRAAMPRLGAVA